MVSIPDNLRKCVAFLGCPVGDGSFHVAGSVFFYGKDQGGYTNPTFLVTAKHVIQSLKRLGCKHAVIRFNTLAGSTKYLISNVDDWFFHPSDSSIDVAILECGTPSDGDHLVLPSTLSIPAVKMAEKNVQLGSDVIVVGLFTSHFGSQRNIPIVRVGNLACLSEEKVEVREYGNIDAYLVEMHSTGGLSGSPVLVKVPYAGLMVGTDKAEYYFLGLMHGHFESEVRATGKNQFAKDEKLAMIHTGISIVVPVEKIDELINLYIAEPKVRDELVQASSLEHYAPNRRPSDDD